MRSIFSSLKWRAHVASADAPAGPPTDVFGRILPFNERLEGVAGKYRVWRRVSLIGAHESDPALARRAALAICEAIETKSQELAAMENELDLVLGFER
jgi:hypothetical protein